MTQLVPIRPERHTFPKCPDCGARMSLFGIEPHPTIDQTDLLTYVCSHCDEVQTELAVPGTLAPADSLLAEKAFDAETTYVLGSVFDAAWERIETSNTVPTDQSQAASMRELLAKFIIAAVEQGETDPHCVMEKALLRLKITLRRDGVGASG